MFEYHVFYVLYPFVTNLLTHPRIIRVYQRFWYYRSPQFGTIIPRKLNEAELS
jgi:hypothetical protein